VFTEIAPDVVAVSHRLVDGKNTIVFGSRGALAVDACNYADEGQAMADFIRGRGAHPDRLALTHGHGDHILGSGAFRGADVYAHVLSSDTIEAGLPAWADRYFDGALERAEAMITRPNVLFDSTLSIDLGHKTARLFATPGHCPDALCVYLEEDRVLCAGDTVVTCIPPAINDGNSCQLEATLCKLLQLDIQILVPGHGPLLRGPEAVREHLQWTIGYLRRTRAFVELALGAGDAVEDDGCAQLVGDRLAEEPFGTRRRHRMLVDRIIAEVRATRSATP
jgi:glyoxylase-like metal-dependent hydrolase (beta-lactamase superfamily II)